MLTGTLDGRGEWRWIGIGWWMLGGGGIVDRGEEIRKREGGEGGDGVLKGNEVHIWEIIPVTVPLSSITGAET